MNHTLDTLYPPHPFMGYRVLANPYMTETVQMVLRRHFRPGTRRGRRKDSPVKFYHLPSVTVPMKKIIAMPEERILVVHPDYLMQVEDIVVERSHMVWGRDDITQEASFVRVNGGW